MASRLRAAASSVRSASAGCPASASVSSTTIGTPPTPRNARGRADVSVVVEGHGDGDAGERVVAVTARELDDGAAGSGGGQRERGGDRQLPGPRVGLERSAQVVVRGDGAPAGCGSRARPAHRAGPAPRAARPPGRRGRATRRPCRGCGSPGGRPSRSAWRSTGCAAATSSSRWSRAWRTVAPTAPGRRRPRRCRARRGARCRRGPPARPAACSASGPGSARRPAPCRPHRARRGSPARRRATAARGRRRRVVSPRCRSLQTPLLGQLPG
jgi:hypothetical protein